MDGILIVDKPSGITSHDVVDFMRKRFRIKKVGHAGTLDPQASGVLLLLVGKATKISSILSCYDKEYLASLTLGIATDTQDQTGQIIKRDQVGPITIDEVRDVFGQFLGEGRQVPPMFSALKYKGQRLYQLARRGLEVKRKPRRIIIHKLKITKFLLPDIDFRIECSKGTYVRTLCVDIAGRLKLPGYMSKLRRVSCGPFKIDQAFGLQRLQHFSMRQLEDALIDNASYQRQE
jgi:tRNA pseudouridine55 synthase